MASAVLILLSVILVVYAVAVVLAGLLSRMGGGR